MSLSEKTSIVPIPVNEPLLDGKEKEYLIQCIETGWISSEGPFVREFEEKFSARVGRQFGIAVVNGSAALDLAVVACGIGPGDEVILPTFTIISCAAAIVRAGATPVVVDSDASTWNMDVTQIESLITPRTKAIMVVHIYGLPVDMNPVVQLAEKHGLIIIEDAAEMHGQMYLDRPCGSFGLISIFSFYPNKHITTGEGGMVVTNDRNLADKCRSLRNLCFLPEKRFVHEELGWNFRMTNMQAALGLAQLEQLDRFIKRKREIGQTYRKYLSHLPEFTFQPETTRFASNIYWVFGLVLNRQFPLNALEFMQKLTERKVGTRPFFYPMHLQPVFRKMNLFKNISLPVSENLAERGFYLPSGLAITDSQIEMVSERVIKVINETNF